ncbi:MAG: LarC family nickel insertion protein [Gammaproteobacteria bacterium]|nr:LarC family nickel insertion protein [Gammaproteobacteria bacterium]
MHLHLDAVGGIAGDMFVAALLDLRPDLAAGAIGAARAAGLGADIDLGLEPFDDGVLTGSRFVVARAADEARGAAPPHGPGASASDHGEFSNAHGHAHGHADAPPHDHEARPVHARPPADQTPAHAHDHGHVHWAALRERLATAPLAAPVRERAIAIFAGLAEAEARVHGKPVEAVSFHEVGAWDSIADIVAAAWLIEALGATSWSVGPLPLGSGRVRTAHGLLPVPAPATVLLLEGLPCFDDGHAGERITPTGAAILKHLAPGTGLGTAPRVLGRVGHGFGTRRLRGLSNVLRVLAFDDAGASAGIGIDQVTRLAFEIDDQTPEDLALGLERLRAVPGVIDVTQGTVTAKQGRQAATVRVLAEVAAGEAVAAACFRETTTLGVRLQRLERRVLQREPWVGPDGTRVKRVRRPDTVTAKAELADLAEADGHAAREARRRTAEDAALDDTDGGAGA